MVAALKSLCELAGIEVPQAILPSIALRVETEQLGITAGLQDRVVQCYGGLVAMNFGEMTTDARFGVSHGDYRQVSEGKLPPLFVAYREHAAEPSEVRLRLIECSMLESQERRYFLTSVLSLVKCEASSFAAQLLLPVERNSLCTGRSQKHDQYGSANCVRSIYFRQKAAAYAHRSSDPRPQSCEK